MVPGLTRTYLVISPGRFFAVNIIEALFVYIVMTYDIKFGEEKVFLLGVYIAGIRILKSVNVMVSLWTWYPLR